MSRGASEGEKKDQEIKEREEERGDVRKKKAGKVVFQDR